MNLQRRTGYGYDGRIEIMGPTGMAEARRHRTGAVSRYSAGKVIDDGMPAGRLRAGQPTYAAAIAHLVAALDTG